MRASIHSDIAATASERSSVLKASLETSGISAGFASQAKETLVKTQNAMKNQMMYEKNFIKNRENIVGSKKENLTLSC